MKFQIITTFLILPVLVGFQTSASVETITERLEEFKIQVHVDIAKAKLLENQLDKVVNEQSDPNTFSEYIYYKCALNKKLGRYDKVRSETGIYAKTLYRLKQYSNWSRLNYCLMMSDLHERKMDSAQNAIMRMYSADVFDSEPWVQFYSMIMESIFYSFLGQTEYAVKSVSEAKTVYEARLIHIDDIDGDLAIDAILASAYSDYQDKSLAIMHFLKVERAYAKREYHNLLLVTQFNLAALYAKSGDFDNSELYFNKALNLVNQYGSEASRLRILLGFTHALLSNQEYKKAQLMLQRALQHKKALNGEVFVAKLALLQTWVYVAKGQPERAERAFAEVEVTSQIMHLTLYYEIVTEFSSYFESQGDLVKALTYQKQLMQLKQEKSRLDAQRQVKEQLLVLRLQDKKRAADKYKREKELSELKLAFQTRHFIVVFALIIASLAAVVSLFYILRLEKQKKAV